MCSVYSKWSVCFLNILLLLMIHWWIHLKPLWISAWISRYLYWLNLHPIFILFSHLFQVNIFKCIIFFLTILKSAPACWWLLYSRMGWLCFHNCYFCSDEDECQDEKHNCHANAQCNNTFGSYNCTCLNGYSGNGVSCLGTCHSLKRVLSREYKATQPCVVFWVIKDFLSTGWKTRGMLLKIHGD